MKDKGILIVMLCTVVIVMAVAFAAFTTNLTINGTTTIGSTWKVEFDQDTAVSKCSDGSGIAISGTTATLAVSLETPGDQVTCTIGVKNTGTLDAVLKSITAVETGEAPITFTLTPSPNDDLTNRAKLAASTGRETITLVATYDDTTGEQPDELTKNIVVTANYQQFFNAQTGA